MRRSKGGGTVVAVVTKHGTRYRARKRAGTETVYGTLRKNKREAEADLLTLGFEQPETKEVPTLGEYAKDLLLGKFATGHYAWKRTTWETSETIWRLKVQPSPISSLKLDEITRRDVQRFIDSQAGSPSWVRRIGAFVSRVLTEALRDELIESDPSNGTRYPEVQVRENRTLSPEEAIRLLNPTDRMSAMILLAAHTGMRRGELCGLKWEDVSDERIVIRRSLAAVRGGVLETLPKTPESRAIIPLTPEAADTIQSQPRRSEYVFTTDSGLPINPSNLSRDWKRWCEGNKIDGRMRLHDLRGSFVSLLLESGADIRTVQELARHADSRTTMKVYARSRMDTKVAAVELLRGTITENRVQNRVQSGALEVSVAGA